MSRVTRITRDPETISITNAPSTSAGIPLASFAGGNAAVVSTSGTGDLSGKATFRFYIKPEPNNSSYYLLVDAEGVAITRAGAPNQAFELPPESFACKWVVPVLAQGSAVITYTLKG